MAMLANKIKAEQAEQWGLIYQVVDDENLSIEATEMATYLASQPTEALANIKQLINQSFEHSLDEQLEKEKHAMQHLGRSDNYREGVSAFMQKRTPNFKG
jgi:2-(1,2-epoxy-1,2-dihydrophenyl)acetyl-CoA isomerase